MHPGCADGPGRGCRSLSRQLQTQAGPSRSTAETMRATHPSRRQHRRAASLRVRPIGCHGCPPSGQHLATSEAFETRGTRAPGATIPRNGDLGLPANLGRRVEGRPCCSSARLSLSTLPPRQDLGRPRPPRRAGAVVSRSRTTSITVVGGMPNPTPHSRTTGALPPRRPTAAPCVATSTPADAPFKASNLPPNRARGIHQATSRSSGATARAVTTSAGLSFPTHSSARARTTVVRVKRSSFTTSSRNATRRANGSTSVTVRSGRATASTIPGKPAPDPTSTTNAPGDMRGAMAAQFSRCRSQMRGASLGPINPRITPSVARRSA